MLALRDDVAVSHQVQQGRQGDSQGSRHAALQAPLNARLLRHSLPPAPVCALPLPSRAAQLKGRLHRVGQGIVQPCKWPRSNLEVTGPMSDSRCSIATQRIPRPRWQLCCSRGIQPQSAGADLKAGLPGRTGRWKGPQLSGLPMSGSLLRLGGCRRREAAPVRCTPLGIAAVST